MRSGGRCNGVRRDQHRLAADSGRRHLLYGVAPDIAVFAKALSNGHPMAAIIGRAEVMQAAQESFISSSYWTEGVGPVAALATVHKMQRVDVPGHIATIGARLCQGLQRIAAREAVPLTMCGHPAMTYFDFDHPQALALQTLLTVRMLRRGFLAGAAFLSQFDAHAAAHRSIPGCGRRSLRRIGTGPARR